MESPSRGRPGLRRALAASLGLATAVVSVGMSSFASARDADFSPVSEYHLCSGESVDECQNDYSTDAAVQFRIELAQDEGEEEIEHISLRFAPGFRFPKDASIADGEQLGTARIETAAGPGCAGAAGSAPLEIDGNFTERDRTDAEIAEGVRSSFV